MAADTEFISGRNFNEKIKDYLRDYYVYQFKHRNLDYFDKSNMTQSRMVAGCILSTLTKVTSEQICKLQMKNFVFKSDATMVSIVDKQYTVYPPLSEMLRYMYIPEPSVYFLTGHEGEPDLKKFERVKLDFNKDCTRKTPETMYRYWGKIFLSEVNANVKSGSYRNDSLRIKTLIEKMPGVKWTHGKKIDYKNNSVDEKKLDTCVECITVDTSTLPENPFHMLYGYCNRYSSDGSASKGEHFSLYYAVLLYLQLGNTVQINNCAPINPLWLKAISSYLMYSADMLESEERKHDHLGWENLSEVDKELYAYKAMSKFINQKGEVDGEEFLSEIDGDYRKTLEKARFAAKDIYQYLARNKKSIIYANGGFEVIDDLDNYASRDMLYEFYSSLTEHRYGIQKRQFFNVLDELAKTGVIIKNNEIVLSNPRSTKRRKDNVDVQSIRDSFSDCKVEISEVFNNYVYIIKYSYGLPKERVDELREKLKENFKGWDIKFSDCIYYKLSSILLHDIVQNLPDNIQNKESFASRFSDMVSFFSQTAVLGEIGNYIMQRLPVGKDRCSPNKCFKNKFRYKHSYLIRALNDYNLIDLLFAIKNKMWVDIEYRDPINDHQYQHFVGYPIEIRENVFDGKQFLLYYHPGYRSVSSVRVDYIDKILIGKRDEEYYVKDDLSRARQLIGYTWGVSFNDFFEGNVKTKVRPSKVKFIISYDPSNENFIRARIRRELRNGKFDEIHGKISSDGTFIAIQDKENQDESVHCLKVLAEVVNPWDMLHWIRSYTKRIVSVEFAYNGFVDDAVRSYKYYSLPSNEKTSITVNNTNAVLLESFDDKFTPVEVIHDRLFNEIYSISFSKLGNILYEILREDVFDEQKKEIASTEYSKLFCGSLISSNEDEKSEFEEMSEKRKKQAKGFIEDFLYHDDTDIPIFSFLKNSMNNQIKDILPLSSVEVQWLRNVLQNSLSKYFLDQNDINYLMSALPSMDYFDINDVTITDQFADVSEFYMDVKGTEQLRKIMAAIDSEKYIIVKYKSQYGRLTDYKCAPVYIEYSKRDNRFRVRGVCNKKSVKAFNLERVVDIVNTDASFDITSIEHIVDSFDKENEKSLVVYFNELNDVPNRILSEFACYKKTCMRWGTGKYRMTLFYNHNDRKEIIIRLLSYGSLIRVCDDTGDVLNEMKDRIRNQLELSRFFPSPDIIIDNDGLTKIPTEREE